MGNFQKVSEQFVQHYYQTFDTNRQGLQSLYMEHSMMTWEGEQFQGAAAIMNKFTNLQFRQVQHQVQKIDAQPVQETPGGCVIFVTGVLCIDGEAEKPLKFAQVFHLIQPPSGGIMIINDMFLLNIG